MLMGVGVVDGGGVCGGGVCMVAIDPVEDKVWLVVRSPAVSVISIMPVMTIAIIASDLIFLSAKFFPLD